MRAEANTNSANCAHDRRDYSCAVLGLVVDVPVIVQRTGAQFTVVTVVDIPVVVQRQFPMVQSEDH